MQDYAEIPQTQQFTLNSLKMSNCPAACTGTCSGCSTSCLISLAVLALHQQHAELDEDIALVLGRHANDPLDVEIDQLEVLLSTMETQRTVRGDPPSHPMTRLGSCERLTCAVVLKE